jgi:undecaprenyl-diphosphatase
VDYGCKRTRELKSLKMKDALIVGAVQCLALMPGVSRSGSTMTAGRALGFNREAAARFSFLLSAPVTAAALVFELRKWRELLEPTIGVDCLLVGAVSSFIFGWLAIDVLLKVVRRYSYLSFALYRAGLAAVLCWVYLR